MVDAGGGKQQRLPGGTEVGREAREDRLAQRLGARRTAGLAGANHIEAKRRETLLEAASPGPTSRRPRRPSSVMNRPFARPVIGAPSAAALFAGALGQVAPNEAHLHVPRARRLKPGRLRVVQCIVQRRVGNGGGAPSSASRRPMREAVSLSVGGQVDFTGLSRSKRAGGIWPTGRAGSEK